MNITIIEQYMNSSKQRYLPIILGFFLSLGLFSISSNVIADPAEETIITITTNFLGGGEFTATGGVVCDHGTISTDFTFTNGKVQTFHGTKKLICDDSNTFTIQFNSVSINGKTKGGWAVKEGTNIYLNLNGGGQLEFIEGDNVNYIKEEYIGHLTLN